MKEAFNQIKTEIDALTVFSEIKNDPVIASLRSLLSEIDCGETEAAVKCYSEFTSALYMSTANLSAYIKTLLLEDDNFYVKRKAAGDDIEQEITDAVKHELKVLERLASLTSEEISKAIEYDGFLPSWKNEPVDFQHEFAEKMENIAVKGYGIFSKYSFFRLDDGEIVPVAHPDCQPLDTLFGYERERSIIVKNTKAFVDGQGASNMLLYGDAGTGKSSTVKSVAEHFSPCGLRLIEVKKNQLYQIPGIVEELSSNPLKFIFFIDDLSFSGNDDNFSALKAILEGSISGCGDNTVIYATSNRRHLVKETFADRMGDELHVNDTLQETMSLSARFGLSITFQKPDKDEYLHIVKSLAEQYGVEMDEAELFRKAEAHAIRKNGRSPRTAKQFVELLKIGL